jgi:hypothetical protein
VFFMCSHEISYVESQVCVKASCFDDNLVHLVHITSFGTLSLHLITSSTNVGAIHTRLLKTPIFVEKGTKYTVQCTPLVLLFYTHSRKDYETKMDTHHVPFKQMKWNHDYTPRHFPCDTVTKVYSRDIIIKLMILGLGWVGSDLCNLVTESGHRNVEYTLLPLYSSRPAIF